MRLLGEEVTRAYIDSWAPRPLAKLGFCQASFAVPSGLSAQGGAQTAPVGHAAVGFRAWREQKGSDHETGRSSSKGVVETDSVEPSP